MTIRRMVAGIGAAALVMAGTAQQAQAAPPERPPRPAPSANPSANPPKAGDGGRGTFRRGTVRTGLPHESKLRRPRTARADGEPTLKVKVLDRDGSTPTTERNSRLYIWPLDGSMPFGFDVENGHAEGSLPKGDHIVYTKIYDRRADGRASTTLIYLPKVSVTGDLSLTLDGRRTRPARVTADRADAAARSTAVLISQRVGADVRGMTIADGDEVHVSPAAPGGDLGYHVQARLTRNGQEQGSPYVYNIASRAQGIPADPSVRVRAGDLAAVRTRYTAQGRPGCTGTHAAVDWGIGTEVGLYESPGRVPAERTEYYSPDVAWNLDAAVTTPDCSFEEYDLQFRTGERFRAGTHAMSWHTAPQGPAAGRFVADRDGQNLVEVPVLTSWDADGPLGVSATTGDTTVRNAAGEVVATSTIPGLLDGWEPARPGPHTVTVDGRRAASWSDLGIRQHIAWNVTVTDPKADVPLPVIRYRTDLDASNRARPGSTQVLSLVPDGPLGRAGAAPSLWTSADDGKSWRPVALTAHDDGWRASFPNPPSGHVSLRVRVPGVVDQTVIRAYGVG
ncbi:hypothetical protein [Actinomadura kijaniata]|uniref:hypothetical protein n=1 Tax=Actinomadura kijaniata TaxID=46161 RepID=UPI000835E7B3|nr:hypothetical protein [Actinomadura kijaniata]